MTATLTNGAVVAAVRERLAESVRATGAAPGRRVLAAELGVTEYAIRQAVAELDRAPAEPVPATGPAELAPTVDIGRQPVAELAPAGAHDDPAGEIGRPVGDAEPVPGARGRTRVARWPLLLLAAPAFVAIWGGWVGLGELAGFGVIRLLPGIWDGLRLNTAVTLPIGLETYAAYALHVALSGRAPTRRARVFAAWSAVASLVLGALGQVAYHLMTAAGMIMAPWWITAMVATLPVVVLGMGAALAHLIAHTGDDEQRLVDLKR